MKQKKSSLFGHTLILPSDLYSHLGPCACHFCHSQCREVTQTVGKMLSVLCSLMKQSSYVALKAKRPSQALPQIVRLLRHLTRSHLWDKAQTLLHWVATCQLTCHFPKQTENLASRSCTHLHYSSIGTYTEGLKNDNFFHFFSRNALFFFFKILFIII